MKRFSTEQKFGLICFCFFLSAIMPAFVPFTVGKNGELNRIGYAVGVLFWGGFIIGSVGYLLLYREEKKNLPEETKHFLGICFFRNPFAKVMDLVMAVGIAGTIYCAVNIKADSMLVLFFLIMLLIGIYAHFLFNGKLFQYIWNQKKENKKTSDMNVERKE